MRSYGQYCAVAKALEVVGDRWTLLIVRELLLRGACRYTDLRNGLPGIATNLLADRLKELEESGIIRREAAPPPIATTLFHLTPRGEELRAVIESLGRWGGPLLASAPPDDEFRTHWLEMPLGLHLKDATPDRPPISIEVWTGEEPVVIEVGGGTVRTRLGRADHPDGILSGSPRPVLGLLLGNIDLTRARALGAQYEGDLDALQRVRPRDPREA